ncbi:MAG TPA: hypothetical protein EYH06_13085 [Chromatiales bacterium]|nr:hypothetical protein [Thiotrichales bacterium]HIP69497.1 hypothetical protein [Chromatiales bacterium]
MILSDIQPHYFPRLHYFARMLESDHFVIRDDVQFVKNHKFPDGTRGVSHQVHSPIKTNSGKQLLTVSVKKGGTLPINQTLISYDQPWAKKHLNLLKSNYTKAPEFTSSFSEIELILGSEYKTVSDLNIATICWAFCRLLGIQSIEPENLSLDFINSLLAEKQPGKLRKITLGSAIYFDDSHEDMNASEKIVNLCKEFGATNYVTGSTAFESYFDQSVFQDNDIQVQVQNWVCHPYLQQHTNVEKFIPNLSIIDLLTNCPAEQALELLLPQ